MENMDGNLLKGPPFETPAELPQRNASAYNPMHTFDLPRGANKQYKQQYADMYFLRLAQLREAVRQRAEEAWGNYTLGAERAEHVDRVLDVRQGKLCWVIGTAYLEMGLKPSILDDISKEHWMAAPVTRSSYQSANDEMMLEDESGRLRITGVALDDHYVTGCVLAALGSEQADGTFQVIATQYADLPPQPERWERDNAAFNSDKSAKPKREKAGKLAIVSGLQITGTGDDDLSLDLLMETLTAEAGAAPDQNKAAGITRLMIAGDSLSHASPIPSREEYAVLRKNRKHYGYDASAYNASPSEHFDAFLAQILPSLPVTLLPGASDPANVALPQQPLHPALFPTARTYASPSTEKSEAREGLDCVTNPWEGDIEGWRVVGSGGQNVSDLLKYVSNVDSIEVMELMLRWRCIAPTAPDTLWCYPFQDDDPLIVKECPHIYIVGNQDKFEHRAIAGPDGQQVVLICVPKFAESKSFVLVDMETLEVEEVDINIVQGREETDDS